MPKRPGVGTGALITKHDRAPRFKRGNLYGGPISSSLIGHLKYKELLKECAIREM